MEKEEFISTSPEAKKEWPYPLQQWAASCCGAVEVSLANSQDNASTFLEKVKPIRFHMYRLKACTLGCFIMKELLPASHPLVVEVQEKKLKNFHLLPVGDRFFTFLVVEEAEKMEFPATPTLLGSLYDTLEVNKRSEDVVWLSNLYLLTLEGFRKKTKTFGGSVWYAISTQTEGSPNLSSSFFHHQGFLQFPFNHRVHSGVPRRMLLWVRTPAEKGKADGSSLPVAA